MSSSCDLFYNPLRKDRFGLIDGDIVLYACGFVADKEQTDKDGAKKILDDMLLNFRHTLDLADCRIFLSDSEQNNFRYKVAKTYPYKKGRGEREKPVHHDLLKDYMLDHWEAEVVKKAEADDGLGKAQSKTTILCSIDKDLNMIPGWHYNWKRFTIYYVDTFEAQKHFWTQMLTGDSTDNIHGIKRVGPKKAEQLLQDLESEYALYCKVVQAYADFFGDNARERFEENYDLLMIKGAPVNFRDTPVYEQKQTVQGIA